MALSSSLRNRLAWRCVLSLALGLGAVYALGRVMTPVLMESSVETGGNPEMTPFPADEAALRRQTASLMESRGLTPEGKARAQNLPNIETAAGGNDENAE